MDNLETRSFTVLPADAELREDDIRPRLVLRPIVFNELSGENALPGFRERIDPKAVDRMFREKTDVRALIDHDPSKVLGRITSGTLRLTKEKKAVRADVDLPNTSYARDLVVSLQRGDVSNGSFGFVLLEDDWSMEDGTPLRTIMDMRVFDVSVVTYPVYPDTTVALRSLELWKKHGRPLSLARRQHRARTA